MVPKSRHKWMTALQPHELTKPSGSSVPKAKGAPESAESCIQALRSSRPKHGRGHGVGFQNVRRGRQ